MMTPELEPCSPDSIQVSSSFQVALSLSETLMYQICKWVNECFKEEEQLEIDHS